MNTKKISRINTDIYRILSIALTQKMGDKMLDRVSILEVISSADLSSAKVMINIDADSEKEESEVFSALERASGFLRNEIASNMRLKNTPKLRFIIDRGRENAKRVEQLLDLIHKSNRSGGNL